MTYTATTDRKVHGSRNVKRFREMLGVKQDALDFELGQNWDPKTVLFLEQKESIEPALLQQISNVLKIPVEAFQNFDEDKAVNIIANKFDNGSIGYQQNENCTFHPIDKLIQLHEEKIALYERMLKEKDEMMARSEKLIEGK